MNNFWNSTHGLGWSKYNASSQGIPESKPSWVKCYSERGAGLNPIISYSNELYFLSGGRDSHPILSIDINSGEINWKLNQPPIDNVLPRMFVNNNYLVTPNRLLNVNGSELVSFPKLLAHESAQEDTSFFLGDKHLLRIINYDVDPYRYFLYSLDTKEHQIINLPLIFGELSLGSDLVYGFIQKDEVNHLACCSLEGDIVWEVESPFGILTLNKEIVNFTPENISIFSKENGQLLKRMTSMENQFSEDDIDSFYKSHSLDTLNMLSHGDLSIFSIIEDKLLVKIEGAEIHDYCVSGDLIFTRQGRWDLVAYDRYSGQELWRCGERYAWQSLIASNNKLIIYCATGDIVCFDCGEPYISPNRPG
jgi:hypothetical protein